MIGVAVIALALLVWAWMRRTRRDARYRAPMDDAPAGAAVIAAFPGLYVATTRHHEPLERLAIRGLGFRSRADITVTDAGVILALPGQPRMFIAVDRIADAAQATVAIDRVVDSDGLARLSWRIDAATVVDTYLRPQAALTRTPA